MASAGMVILASIGVGLMATAYKQHYWEHKDSFWVCLMLGFGSGMADGFQAIVHYMLATKYQLIARDMPVMFDGKDAKRQSECSKDVNRVLWFLNIVCGPLKGFATFWQRNIEWHKLDQPNSFQATTIVLMFDVDGFCEIVSGIILLSSVIKIRRFFRERDSSQMDTSALCRHASCYVLYLFAVVAYFVM